MEYQYQVGGSLSVDAVSYVERKADCELYQYLLDGECCYVFNSRQMGKTSLLIQAFYRLKQKGHHCAIVDLTTIGSEEVNPLQWYKGMVTQIYSELGLTNISQLKDWWKEQQDFSYLQILSRFIDQLLTVHFPTERIFIFVDEIDTVLSLGFTVDDFFALIRYCYERRAINPNYRRITFALAGVATPSNLIRDKIRTPFNIGCAITLKNFQFREVEPLLVGLKYSFGNPTKIMQAIINWTGGQPFLTQKLCNLVVCDSQCSLAVFKDSKTSYVDNLVKTKIIDNWEYQDEPEHLKTIRDRLLYNPQTAGRLLGIYQQIIQFGWVIIDNTPEQTELLLSGVVIKEKNYLVVKNLIYKKVFNRDWVKAQLANLRPYRIRFDAWLKYGDTAHLLTDLKLKEALAWAEDKQLSDLDYRFLNASQQLAQQETEQNLVRAEIEREKAQFALYAVREANRLLAIARQNANRKIRQLRLSPNWIGIIAIAVSLLTISLRLTGSLQGLELTALDLYFQQRPTDIAPRVTIITIDESDIGNLGYPLSDRILAIAIAKITEYKPRIIGLNLYRDLSVPPGNTELQKIFDDTPNLIGIKKVVGAKILPPPQLAEANKIGFADLVFDDDGAIRRALLSIRDDDIKYSFALRLALEYLQAQNITPQPLANTASHIKLGKTVLIPFQPNDGGYIRADAGGYQTIINYRGTLAQFTNYSISRLLTGTIPIEDIKDRVVLIGAIAPTINDLSPTPYSRYHSGITNQMAWVTIHANIISQLLSAAIDGRAMLRTISNTGEWLCILIGAMLGASVGWWLRNWYGAIALLIISIAAIMLTYLAFLFGLWLPIVAMAIALFSGAVAITAITQRQLSTLQLKETAKQLIIISDSQPTVKKVAFELLKQGEEKKNRAAIEKVINH